MTQLLVRSRNYARANTISPVTLGLLLVSSSLASAQPTDSTRPLRQFLAIKTPLRLQKQSATQFSFSSGAWHGTSWTHRARVFEPQRNEFPGTATILLLTDPMPFDVLGGQIAADATGTTLVMIYDVPNQPLWRRRENGLLGYSLQKMAQSGDPSWSLAFPMARATARSMDAVEAWSRTQKTPLERFVLVGFSKRAMGAWLAATDARVAGLVSLGYNNLNLPAQARLQKKNWGEVSTHWTQMVGPDFERQLETSQGQQLIASWDPFSFRAHIKAPKLLLDATNNDYWSLDSPEAFAPELRGTTNWLYFANSGHFMERAFPQLVQTSASWIRRTLRKQTLTNPTLRVSSSEFEATFPGASNAVLNFAWSQSRDFRRASWSQITLKNGRAPRPKTPQNARFLAAFVTANYPPQNGAGALSLSSRVQITH